MVETATVLGRTVYACDACAKPQVFVCGEDGKEEEWQARKPLRGEENGAQCAT
jgi:hypothetical protein